MKTTALIVTYNRLHKLMLCWRATSIVKFDSIVIVDNASSDGTEQWLSTLDTPNLYVIRLENNLGGAGGFKRGAEYISSSINTDWVFFFDDDAYPAPDLLDNFLRFDTGKYKLLCSKVITPSGAICRINLPYKKIPRTFIDSVRYFITPSSFLPEPDTSGEVATFSFVGSIIHKDIIVEYHHEIRAELFIYYDDVFFSYFLSRKGYSILYCPQFVFTHDKSDCVNIYSNWKLYYLVRNLLLSRKIFFHNAPYTSATIFLKLLKITMSWIIKGRSLQSLSYLIQGLKDGLLGKTGKRH